MRIAYHSIDNDWNLIAKAACHPTPPTPSVEAPTAAPHVSPREPSKVVECTKEEGNPLARI